MSTEAVAASMLSRAARAGARGLGRVEPNPAVGCVLARGDAVLAIARHARYGGPHAEAAAIARCRTLGIDMRGATAYVTLEPCAHTGRTPPCAEALIGAGVDRVVFARADPNPIAQGGAARLRGAGIEAECSSASRIATRLSDPFVKRMTTGLPWVIAKWAQTIDGRVATRARRSKWISNERSRRAVHRLRGRVDAILTGIGTVRDDDPMLTARDVVVRRAARRVVIDPHLELALDSSLVRTSRDQPVCAIAADEAVLGSDRAQHLRDAGVELRAAPALGGDGEVDLREVLSWLATSHDATNVLIEAGPGVLSRFHDHRLIDEARVFIAPRVLGDGEAIPPLGGASLADISDAPRWTLERVRRWGDDLELRYLTGVSVPA
ncbi:MAG: bifunctional diaminohydroxyphosphoribosylaminopyrimidine deaminase/5-amino-6-(5-phosphoribosylamino)uracil reductase RibD [Planctomycetota bacterium]